jgi:glycosyltransferase involved in cell wall biosynthesis
MRVLNLVAGQKWTGTAAVVADQTAALIDAGIEAQFGFVGDSPLADRLAAVGWARPLLTHSRNPLHYASEVRRVRATIRREGFGIVHAHATHDHYVAAFAVRGTPAAVARTFHHVRHVRRDRASRALFRRTRAFAFANAEIARRFGATGPIHPPVVDAERFRPGPADRAALAPFDLPSGTLLVGTVGKMAADRGHAQALEALARVPGSASFVHVGHGESLPELKAQAERLGISGRNFWLGYQEEALPELYRAWNVFLFPASGSEQGQRAILEAMASGVPVVAVDVPGVRDLVTDGREGYVVDAVGTMAEALRTLLESMDLRRRMGEAGRKRALEFTGRSFAARAREFYEGICGTE